MIKYLLIGLGALVLFQVIRNNQSSSSSGGSVFSSGTPSAGGLTGFVNSLSGLTSSIGKLFGGSSSSGVSDRDGLIKPNL